MCEKMKWDKLLIEKRFYSSGEDEKKDEGENGRTQFQKDIDRITFSSAFRRLGRKTQVHLLTKNDHIHTRLSHSLEVACVGRTLGVMVGDWLKCKSEDNYPKDFPPSKVGEIVQAACLAHDIGTPPFGHAAEEAIRKWFEEDIDEILEHQNLKLEKEETDDLKNFDGNAMSFRVVTYKEYYIDNGGMRLTYPTLGALLKYPWTSHFAENNHKFSCFKTEFSNLFKIANKLGLVEKEYYDTDSKAKYARHPLSYLVEAADDICYRVLDIEDAIQLNILPPKYLKEGFEEKLGNELKKNQRYLLNDYSVSWNIKNGLLRSKMIGRMIEEVLDVFKTHYDEIMHGNFQGSLFSKTAEDSICSTLDPFYKNDENDENKKLKDRIYRNKTNVPLELGAYSLLHMLLETIVKAACEIYKGKDPSYKTKIIKKFVKQDSENQFTGKSLYEIIILLLDYVIGMTDNYATDINKQLLGLGN